MKPWVKAVVAAVAGMVLLSALVGCADGSGSSTKTKLPAGTPGAAVQAFHDADTKHGTLVFSNVWDDGTVEEQDIEYWFDGGRYRLTWYNDDGSVRLHMISPDGEKVYHCRPDEKACVLAYTSAEFHQWIFNGPPDWTPDDGVEEDALTKFTYSAKKLWSVEGASQSFYLEDLVIYADGTRITSVITRTNSRVPDSEDELVSSTYTFDEPDLGIEIAADMFELPYDIVESD